MFDVEMLVINNSMTDTVESCVASIELPDGLSLAEMTEDKPRQSLTQSVDFIDYGGTHSFHWYVKGDKEGDYDIKGMLSGVLMPFEEEFNYTYSLESPIHVYAGTAIHMTVFAPVAAYHGEKYNFKIQFENVSDRPIYGFTNTIAGVSQYKRSLYSNGVAVTEKLSDGSEENGSQQINSLDTFYPGDKIIIESSVDILFEAEMVKRKLEGAVESLEQLRAMLDSTSAYGSVMMCINDTNNYFKTVIQYLENLKSSEANADKSGAYENLLNASKMLYEEFSSSDERAVDIVAKLKLSDYYDDLKRYALKYDTLANAATERLNQVAEGFNAVCESEIELNVSVLDEIKAAVCALPMRFILSDVSVITLSGSTTEIPYSVELLPDTNERYSEVLHLTNLINALITDNAGGLDAPRTARCFNGSVSADKHVKFTENTVFLAVSASNEAEYKAWVEESDSENICDAFTLSCDAEDSVFDNGYLTFTKSGNITVSADEGCTGVLKIETARKDGTTTVEAYMLESVKEHQCKGEKREVIVPSDLVTDGIKAVLCDECNSVIGTEAYRDEYLGDVNNDGVIDVDDAVLIFSYDADVEELSTEQLERADTTDDGKITSEDAMLILMDDTSMTGNYVPNADITRAVFVVVLYRMEGQPECSTVCSFGDVSSDAWYRNAIIWASENGIVKGVTSEIFNPEGNITREQMAALMYRYAKYKNAELEESDVEKIFNDSDKVSDYAKDAVSWVSSTGLMLGNTDGRFAPLSMATKEHTAIVLVRMMKMLK